MNDDLKAQEEIGRAVRAFLESPLGRYLQGCIQQELAQAKDELLQLDPHEFDELVKLQNKLASIRMRAKIVEGLQGYLAEAIVLGNQAAHQLDTRDE